MKRVIVACVFFGFLCDVGFAFTCRVCDPKNCPEFNPKDCKVGITKDVCNCCPVCYKNVGETCGGPWNMFGVCARHLTCTKPFSPSVTIDPFNDFDAEGKCYDWS
uniref:U29-Theraphotoxin-Sfo1a_1 n=1 Tax=Selenotholus foelschei TaxID=1905327 RepID=A0A482ZH43_9ARAC